MLSTRELTAIMKSVAGVVRDHIAKALASVNKEQAALGEELQVLRNLVNETPAIKDGRDGVDGKDGAPGRDGTPGEKGADGLNGKDGRDGVDGKDGAPGRDGTPGEKGADGLNGKDGRDGVDGKSVTADELLPTVKQWFDALRRPADGKDGADGDDGEDGRDGTDGKSVTLEDVVPLLESMQAKWALDFERRAQDLLQRAVDRIPAPKNGTDGQDGKDGLGFDDMEVVHDGERTFTFRLTRGERVKEFKYEVPALIYRGIFKEGTQYVRGDVVTWGGSAWHCKEATVTKPDDKGAWVLIVKRGADGRSAA